MTKEQIKKASEKFSSKQSCAASVRFCIATGFTAGAKWRIDSAWHEASSVPDKGKLVLFECKRVYGATYTVSYGENHGLLSKVLLRWAYIEDLLPLEKEEQE